MKNKLISSSLFVLLLSVNNPASAASNGDTSSFEQNTVEMMVASESATSLKEKAEELAERIINNSEDAIEIIRTYPYSATITWVYESILERRDQVGDRVDSNFESLKQKLKKMYRQVVSYPYRDNLENAGEAIISYPYGEKTKEAYLFTKYFATAFAKKLRNQDAAE